MDFIRIFDLAETHLTDWKKHFASLIRSYNFGVFWKVVHGDKNKTNTAEKI